MTAHSFPSQDKKLSTICHSSKALYSPHLWLQLELHIHGSSWCANFLICIICLTTTSNCSRPCSLECVVGWVVRRRWKDQRREALKSICSRSHLEEWLKTTHSPNDVTSLVPPFLITLSHLILYAELIYVVQISLLLRWKQYIEVFLLILKLIFPNWHHDLYASKVMLFSFYFRKRKWENINKELNLMGIRWKSRDLEWGESFSVLE